MRTKNGLCSECPLLDKKHIKDFLLTTDKSNVNNPEIFIVTHIVRHGKVLVDFLNREFKDKKYFIINNELCEKGTLDCDCTHFCFSNFIALSKKLEAKHCFVFDCNVDNVDNFKSVKNLDELKKELTSIYKKIEEKKPSIDLSKYYFFNIPSEYYTSKYRLVDVQHIMFEDKLIYIFRDENNKKVFFEYPASQNNFYWYDAVSSNRIVEKIDNLKLVTGKYKNRNKEKNGYGGDVNICTQHCVDYYIKNKDESKIQRQNIMFLDIETYQYHDKIFPDPDEANYPIVAISFRTDREDDFTHVYLVALDGEIDKNVYECVKKYKHVTVFKDEITMLRSWFNKIKSESIDILTAYNSYGFDFPYIVNRIKKLGIDEHEINGYGNIYGDSDRGSSIPGYVLIDQLKLYKEFTHGILPSYSLNNVAKHVLGEIKVDHSGKSIDDMYSDDIDLYLRYSTTDTDLIYQLEKALGHISLQCEIRRVASCSHSQANTTLGQANGIYAKAMKLQGLIGRNYTHDVKKEKLDGAYVFDARPGIYIGLLCDFDFKSLYPSIICTWNIGPDTYIGKVSKDIAYNYIFFKDSLRGKKIQLCLDPLYLNKNVTVTLDQFEQFMKKYDAQITIIGTIFCGHSIKESINYKVLNNLMDSRSIYKEKMLEAKEAGDKILTTEYNDKQLAFKIIANVLYGALGQEHFRFYNPILGESITATGQEMLKYSAVHTDMYMDGRFGNDGGNFFIDPKFADKVKNTRYVVYGDTDSIFVYLTDYLKRKNLKCVKSPEVLDELKSVQNYINKVILPSVLKHHLIKPERSQMYFKNEFLMSRYYALNAKKKYASHVISQEGKDINEIDIKGLEIKRSEIPVCSQKMLKEMVDVILDDNNSKSDIKKKIQKIVDDNRQIITDNALNGTLDIAKVVSYSKKPEEYKVTPQHLLGMWTWNCLMNVEEFKYGSKGKLFNVLGIDLNKAPKDIQDNYYNIYCKKFPNTPIEAIVLPESVQKLPDYFIIDLKQTIKYCCDDRAQLMMSGLYAETDNDLLF